MIQSTAAPPPIFEASPAAIALAADIDAGTRGPGSDSSIGGRAFVYRIRACEECWSEPDRFIRGGMVSARTLALVPVHIAPLHAFAANGVMDPGTSDEGARAWGLAGQYPLQGHSHHTSLGYAKLLRLGVRGILEQVDSHEAKLPANNAANDARSFYAGLRLALNGFLHYAGRYRAEALRLLQTERDAERRLEIERIADALARIPYEPANTFFDAMQSFLLMHFATRTHEPDGAVGRFDVFMAPYYEADLAAGRLTREQAYELIQRMMAQLLELSRFSDAIVVGGCRRDGVTPHWNDLTYFVLDAAAALKLPNPEIGFRWCPGMPRDLLRRAMRCITAGTSHPGFFNDPVAIAALRRAEMTVEQAADYVNCNCVEMVSQGRSCIMSGYNYTNLVKPIEIMLNGGRPVVKEQADWLHPTALPPADLPLQWATFDEFRDAYSRYLAHAIAAMVQQSNSTLTWMSQVTPVPLSSCLFEGCIETGRHCMHGGAVCSQTFPSFIGLANAADSLAAIRQAVFQDRRVTMAELAEACRANFESHEPLRQYLKCQCPKYGNDDPSVDELATWIFGRVADELAKYRNIYDQPFAPQYFGFVAHAVKGQVTGATPDGRRSGEAVAGTLGGDSGADVAGPTALLRSVTRLDHTAACGGVAVNLAVSPLLAQSEASIETLIDLLLAYFAMVGMQLQMNCVSADTLRAAQRQPEQHAGLLVRVAGYTDRFVKLDRNVQDQIVERTMHALR